LKGEAKDLRDKLISDIDGELDVLEAIKEQLSMYLVHTARDYRTPLE